MTIAPTIAPMRVRRSVMSFYNNFNNLRLLLNLSSQIPGKVMI